jgi:hypothetical protein
VVDGHEENGQGAGVQAPGHGTGLAGVRRGQRLVDPAAAAFHGSLWTSDPQWDNTEVADKDIWGGPSLLMGSLIEIAGLLPDGTAQAG